MPPLLLIIKEKAKNTIFIDLLKEALDSLLTGWSYFGKLITL
ncbi:hypothetical protein D920_01389 [Enterococcus faecalis 13-SD-W-01]|nr:hypothetical protein D920_01389 [Enterococcus faecalis 13-SD-W-01]